MEKFRLEHSGKVVPDAYHGTELSRAEKIVNDNEFIPSTREDSFLGFGVYFWEGSAENAVWWAKLTHKDSKAYGVLKATVELGRCLDLMAKENRNELRRWKDTLTKRYRDRTITDALAINSYAGRRTGHVDTVRCVFAPAKPKPLFTGSRILDFRLVICVRNVKNISSIALVADGSVKG